MAIASKRPFPPVPTLRGIDPQVALSNLEQWLRRVYDKQDAKVNPHGELHAYYPGNAHYDPIPAGVITPLTVLAGGVASVGTGPSYMLANAQLTVGVGAPVALGEAISQGTGNLVALSNHVHPLSVRVQKAAATVGTRKQINFIDGAGITVTVADNVGGDRVDVTVASTLVGQALTDTDDTNVTITLTGTPASALLQPVNIAVGWAGTLAVARGGTDAANAADARTNLGLAIGSNVQAWNAKLDTYAALAAAAGFLKNDGAGVLSWDPTVDWSELSSVPVSFTPAAHAATHAAAGSDPVTLTQAQITNLVADLAAKQPLDTELTALAGLVSAADRLPYFTGAGTAAIATFTAFGRSLIDDADAAAARATLGVGFVDNGATIDAVSAGLVQISGSLNVTGNVNGGAGSSFDSLSITGGIGPGTLSVDHATTTESLVVTTDAVISGDLAVRGVATIGPGSPDAAVPNGRLWAQSVNIGIEDTGNYYGLAIDWTVSAATTEDQYAGYASLQYTETSAHTGWGFWAGTSLAAAKTIATLHGIEVNHSIAGTVTNLYDLRLKRSGAGTATTHWGIYQETTAARNYFAGTMGVGTAGSTTVQLYAARTSSVAGTQYAIFAANTASVANPNTVVGVHGSTVVNAAAATVALTVAVHAVSTNTAGTTTNAYGMLVEGSVAGTVDTYYGIRISAPTGAGTITTRYGLYQAADTAAQNFLGSRLGIGAISGATEMLRTTASYGTDPGATATSTNVIIAVTAAIARTFNSLTVSGTASHTSGVVTGLHGCNVSASGTGSGGTTTLLTGLQLGLTVGAGHTATTAAQLYLPVQNISGTATARHAIYQLDTVATNILLGGTMAALSVNNKTAGYTVLNTEPGRVFTNAGAGAGVTFTLPTPAAGLTYTFIVMAAFNLVVDAAAGHTIRVAGGVSSSGGTATNATVGSVITIVGVNTTQWIAVYTLGTWTLA
jgi:hypothetical protein